MKNGEFCTKVEAVVASVREMILANLSMISQVPAPTFNEQKRSELLLSRLSTAELTDLKTDKVHNVIAVMGDNRKAKNILISAHIDNQFDAGVDQNITIDVDSVYGAGVADDNMALAVLLTLPDIIGRIGENLDANIILLATTRHHGRGDYAGMRHFIKNYPGRIDAAICLQSIGTNRLNYFTPSRVRCDITCEMIDGVDSPWLKVNNGSAILTATDVVDNLYSIPLPQKPRAMLNIGMISGGERYSVLSREAEINLEILSECDDQMVHLIEEIENRCTDIGAKHGAQIKVDFFGHRKSSKQSSGEPLVKMALKALRESGDPLQIDNSRGDIAVPIGNGIPTISIGLTQGVVGSTARSYVQIEPLTTGIRQLMQILKEVTEEGE